MKIKRILTGLIGLPIVALILVFGNIYVIDTFFGIVSAIAIYEYFNSFKTKYNPVQWIRIFNMFINSFYTYNK